MASLGLRAEKPEREGQEENAHSPVPSDSDDALDFEDAEAGEAPMTDEEKEAGHDNEVVEFDVNDELEKADSHEEGAGTSLQDELVAADSAAGSRSSLGQGTLETPTTPKANQMSHFTSQSIKSPRSPSDAKSDASTSPVSPASPTAARSANPSPTAGKKNKGAGVAALMAKFQQQGSDGAGSSKTSKNGSLPSSLASASTLKSEQSILRSRKQAQETQDEPQQHDAQGKGVQEMGNGSAIEPEGVTQDQEVERRADEMVADVPNLDEKEGYSSESRGEEIDLEERLRAAKTLEGGNGVESEHMADAENKDGGVEATDVVLTDDKETLPPSKGATSLLDPDETIANPFASSPWSESSSPFAGQQYQQEQQYNKQEQHGISGGTDPRRFSSSSSSSSSATQFQQSQVQTPNLDGGVARFSTVSLATTAPVSSSRRQTLLQTQGSGAVTAAAKLAMSEEPSSSASLESAAFVKRQNARLSRDGAVNRNSARGDELKEKLNAIRAKEGNKSGHSRHSSGYLQRNRSANGEEGPREEETSPLPVMANKEQEEEREGGEQHETPKFAQQPADDDVDDDHWDGPPGEELGEDAIDWDFWGDVMGNYQEIARTRPRQLSRAIQTGIPNALRGMMWQLMSSSKDEELELIYAFYLKQTSPHEKNIRKDLARTFPEQDYFQDGQGIGQENLFNVVKAYSLYDEECGYCQGMQFVVGPLLLNMPDEEAFSTLVRLMKSYDLRGHFIPNMPSLQLRLFQYDRLLEDCLPLISKHLTRQGIKSSMYASGWFMTLFSYRCPLDIVLRILDSVFAEGIEALFRFSLALMSKNEEVLLTLPFEEALPLLATRMFDVYKIDETGGGLWSSSSDRTIGGMNSDPNGDGNAPHASSRSSASSQHQQGSRAGSRVGSGGPRYRVNEFIRDAFQFKITPFMLDSYASDFEEQVRARTAHRREVEALKLVNRNLSNKVKELEEQLQQVNKEHVDLVKNVVMTKLAKEEMAEELVRYKTMYAEAVLIADQCGASNMNSPNRQLQQQQQQQQYK